MFREGEEDGGGDDSGACQHRHPVLEDSPRDVDGWKRFWQTEQISSEVDGDSENALRCWTLRVRNCLGGVSSCEREVAFGGKNN